MQADGRVVSDDGKLSRTYSEGQSYALFFALVANDRRRFDALLHWTRDNLSQGDLGQHLPAWLWGRQDDGAWGVIDSNSASDADLWIAYTLLQAGRLWLPALHRPGPHAGSADLAEGSGPNCPAWAPACCRARRLCAAAGPTLQLNPSYLPLQVLQALALDAGTRLAATGRCPLDLVRSAPAGISPDWTLHDSQQGF
jgi:endoglucanase